MRRHRVRTIPTMPRPRRSLLAFLVLGTSLSSACYVYQPAGSAEPVPGTSVRMRVGDVALARASQEVGQAMPPYLEGQIVGAEADSLQLSILVVRGTQDYSTQRTRQILAVARSEVLELQQEELSWPRTLLVGAGVAALAIVVVDQFTAIGDDPGNNNPGFPNAPQARGGFRIPILR